MLQMEKVLAQNILIDFFAEMNHSKKNLPFFVSKCFLTELDHSKKRFVGKFFVTIPSGLIYVDAAKVNCVSHLNPSWSQYGDTLCIALVIRS